ncbi:unnamed protein product [Rotaria sp. Silwood1]|nr:unnamed protein product [Rotaria sp. Silwood1]CAF1531443.1 unnamed protein product [Rotaria sp. Silwood1]
MCLSSEKFSEQYSRIQQQFKEWTQFEQLSAIVELTRTFQSSYHYFLLQLFQTNIQYENDDMFNHTVDDANSPDIVKCLLSNSLDKILFTLQLYLPLITIKTINDTLIDAYHDVLIYLDLNILNLKNFTYSEQQIINLSQQILFFIQTNKYLQKLSLNIPQLIKLVQTNKFNIDEQQQQQQDHQLIQRYSSIHSQPQPLINYSSDNTSQQNTILCQQLIRHEINDSGVDLTEPTITNSLQNFLPTHSYHDRLQRTNLLSTINKHSFVVKTASSPIPENSTTTTINISNRVPLTGVLSAPSPTIYSDYRHKNLNYQQQQQKHKILLTKNNENDLEKSNEDIIREENNINDNSKTLTHFYSLRYPNTKINQIKDNVSQYLGVDANSTSVQNTFIEPNTGMRDVPKWLKHLRLHKYDVFFSKMTYDQMMNLTIEELKELRITDGACTKILLNIKKLKERSIILKQSLIDIDDGQIDLQNFIQQLNELMLTPIRSKQLEQENNSEEDLPLLIMQILEKIYQQLSPNSSPDLSNNLLGLFDRCYRHEAFTNDQRHILLQWRRRLSNTLQSLGKIEYKTIQSSFIHTPQQRRTNGKPPIRPIKSATNTYYTNNSLNTIPLVKNKSEPYNNTNNHFNESNLIQRPNKSPTLIYSTNDDIKDNYLQTTFTGINSTSLQRHNGGTYLANQQHQVLTRKPSINPYDEINTNNHHNNNNKTKLCQTFSEPNKIHFHNSRQSNHIQLSSQQQNLFPITSTPYSQQQQHRHFISRSPPISNTIDIVSSSPIKKCYSDNERSNYYENNNNDTLLSDTNNMETTDDQPHHNKEFESLCLQITESAISDDIHESSSIDYKEENSDISNLKQSSNNSTDTEQ